MDRLLAEATMVAHFGYLAFVVFGGFLAWRWPRILAAHLVAVGCGVVIVAASLDCPLTYVEDELRRRAGQPGLPRGFVDTYIEGVLYPTGYAGTARALAAALIIVSWLGVYLIRRRRPRRSAASSRRQVTTPACPGHRRASTRHQTPAAGAQPRG